MKLYDFIKTSDNKQVFMIMQVGVRKVQIEEWTSEIINEDDFLELKGLKPEIIPVKPTGVYTWLHLGYRGQLTHNGFGVQLVNLRLQQEFTPVTGYTHVNNINNDNF